eukprot:CAMPEP_0203759158 /NCGR_PEP_ID=MMETSP0098-20131031/12108_1 /ASSEMBLY_ACC=CAM_ASM_000208 /TAXON_ID=96639 /ORGANISM=" , Strain NY0313808BC1" /LENGTH=697 /DNA_ID=CAMNT_0050651943 /DNA_START=21 /DNA_END=2114 /DNA_ORIENTATION=-
MKEEDVLSSVGRIKSLSKTLREVVSSIANEKRRGSQDDDDGENKGLTEEQTKQVDKMVAKLHAKGSGLLIQLKRQSRQAFLVAESLLEEMEVAKKSSEAKQLSLQNLLYEKAYLKNEIERCKKFEMKQTGKITLVPMEEFKRTAPQSLLADIASLEAEPSAKEHQTQLSRLSHELLLRRSLQNTLKELDVEKLKVLRETAEQQEFLDELPNKMSGIVKATAPIQKHFGMSIMERLDRHVLCRKLPNALYMIYCQLEAYGDAFGGVSVSIEGETNDAMDIEKEEEEDGDGDEEDNKKKTKGNIENGSKASSKRKREPEPVADEKVSKKAKKVELNGVKPTSNGVSSKAKAEDDNDVFIDCGVVVKAYLQSPNKQVDLTLLFKYFPMLNVVTVEALDHRGILANIYPNDTGQYLPHTLMGKKSKGGLRQPFPENINGRPYKWLQWLAGLYNLTPEGPHATSHPSTRSIVKSILDRVGAQESLSEQLHALEKCPHPVPVHPSAESLFPPKATTKLIKWEEIPANQADERIAEVKVARSTGVPVLYRRKEAVEEEINAWANFGRRCFHGILKTANGKEYEAIVQVFVDYPARAPHFTLFPRDDGALRTIESELNDYANELHANDRLSLLSHQLRRLQMCLGVLSSGSNSAPSVDDELEDNVNGVRGNNAGGSSSSIERKYRGRDRRLAFVYDVKSRTFIHR